MKHLKIVLSIMFLITIASSCDLLDRNLKDRHVEQQGYITDTLGAGIENVKITVLKADTHTAEKEETDMVYYTDNRGYYKINIDNEGYIYYMKMEHDECIYVVKPGNFAYPQIASYQSEDEEQNYEMVKLGKVRVKGIVEEDGLDLGNMQKLQMQKIEELTLYIIELNKQNKRLQERILKLENK